MTDDRISGQGCFKTTIIRHIHMSQRVEEYEHMRKIREI